MGRKRTKGKTAQTDESLDIQEPVCKHIRKGLEQGLLKKALLNVQWNVCEDCKTDNKAQDKSQDETDESPSIWLCLKCGHRGCGRNSQEQHALKHHTTPRSDPHCLVLSLDNWSVWCYLCDNEVPYSSSTRLGQLVDNVRKALSEHQESQDFENKKTEKDNRNEQEKEKREGMIKEETSYPNTNAEVIVKGLSNLGNTCFFNAVMQNLSQTPVLRELLKEAKMPGTTVKIEPSHFSTEPLVIQLEEPGPLTLAMCQFLTEMQETKKGTVAPKELFAQVCKKAIRFKGYQQQDSQELLRYLLDGMRAEEIQRVSVGLLKMLNVSDRQNEELKKKIKEYEKKKGIQTFVDRIFGGELTSTIMCEECRTVSELSILNSQKTTTKSTKERNTKKAKEKETDEEDDKHNDSYMKEREDPGASKHHQKKAKKQAKKQAKNQRRQQKLQGKVLQLTEVCVTEESEENLENKKEIKAEEMNSEVTDLKQEEESSNQCKEVYLNQKDLNNKENCADSQSEHENIGNPEQEGLENENNVADPLGNLVSTAEYISGLDDLPFEEDDHGEDDHTLTTSMSKLQLDTASDSDMDTLDDFDTAQTKIREVVNEDPETAFCTLADREDLNIEEGSIHLCLYQFTCNEELSETNKLLCDVCTERQYGPTNNGKSEKKPVYTNAKKQMLISLAPPILTLHLKRFQQAGFNLRKVNRHIKFPEVIDLAPFCTVKCKNVAEGNSRVLYSLYGVVEHSGTMRSGHYTAYAKMRALNNHLSDLVLHGEVPQASETESAKGQWFHISDTHVQAVSTSKVLSSQAYLLFYERLL
uniref:Ubiquitin carboxyl-terminal hydrolase 16 n=1 Tax=Crocodylus porosus TaxID=8502 RepID=A0A7M4F4E8_CROPO